MMFIDLKAALIIVSRPVGMYIYIFIYIRYACASGLDATNVQRMFKVHFKQCAGMYSAVNYSGRLELCNGMT